jgi:agmatinase
MTGAPEAPAAYERPGRASVALLGLPYDASSSFQRGPAEGPPLVRAALFSDAGNMFSEALVDLGEPGALVDAGDLPLGRHAASTPALRNEIEAGVAALLARGQLPLSLGGDHSVSYPAVRAVAARHGRLALLQVDAHPDLYDSFEGDRYSHACPFARLMEEGLAERLVQVGVRTMTRHQKAQAERFGVEVVTMRDWHPELRLHFDVPVYVSVDVDGIDPGFAPGVSHREPGGLTPREVIRLIQTLDCPAVVGADVVEFNPRADVGGVTATVAAKLVKELAARMLGS